MIERVVIDTSSLISAVLKVGSKPHQALMLALEFCVLCGSEQLIAELSDVLSRSYFERRLFQQDRESFIKLIQNKLVKFSVDETATASMVPPSRDENDNFILALAFASRADAIISSDNDLLVLTPWTGIPILTPAQFVAQFSS